MDSFLGNITGSLRQVFAKTAVAGAAVLAALSVCAAPVRAEERVRVNLPSAGISYALSASKTSVRDVEEKLYQEGVIGEKKVKTASGSVKMSVIAAVRKEAAEPVSAIMETALTPVQEKEKALVSNMQESAASIVGTAASAVTVVSSTQQAREEAMAAAAEALRRAQEAAKASVAADYVSDGTGSESAASDIQGQEEQAETVPEQAAVEEGEGPSEELQDETEAGAEGSGSDEAAVEASDAEQAGETDQNLVVAQVNSYINVRKEPSIEAEIVGKLYSNGVGMVLEAATGDGWMKIQSGDVIGYVKMDYVATGTEAAAIADEVGRKQAVITTTTLRVRAAATTESDVISLIGMGAELDIIGEEEGWYKVNTDDGEGYISADFADLEVIYPVAESREEEERKAAAKRAEQEQQAAAQGTGSGTGTAAGNTAQQTDGSAAKGAAAVAAGTGKGQEVANYAMQFIGNPYVWGGTSLTNGADCSGFTMAVYSHFGVSLPHYDAAQRQCGIAVNSLAEAVPGDLICYYGHVGIYIGNGQIVHASSPRYGIIVGNATYRQISAIRRIFY